MVLAFYKRIAFIGPWAGSILIVALKTFRVHSAKISSLRALLQF